MRPLLRILTALVFAGLVLGGPASAVAANHDIIIAQMQFGAVPPLHVGDVITWRNDDIFRHSVTARDKSFDVQIPANGKGSLTVSKAGTFDYYCRFHPMMKGQLQVAAP